MKRKIALLMAMLLVATLTLSMGTAFAAPAKTVHLTYYENYYPYPVITDYTLPATVSINEGQSFSYTQLVSAGFTINGVMSGTPATVTYAEANDTLKILVTRKTATATPIPTYYYGTGLVGYTGTNPYIYVGNGDYMYAAVELVNPIPNIPVGTVYPLTAGNLAGLSPSNTHLTFGTSNAAVVSNIGAILYGNTPGIAKVYVYYDSSLVLVKDVTVGLGIPTNTGAIVPTDEDLVIGPATFTAAKGKSYRFTKCTLDGEVVLPSTLLWKSSNTGIATVSKSGVIRTLKAGTVTITAKTADGESASVVITVK